MFSNNIVLSLHYFRSIWFLHIFDASFYLFGFLISIIVAKHCYEKEKKTKVSD